MDVDSIADLQDEMAENMQEYQERQDLFSGVAEEGQEDLMAELDDIEADALAGELEGMEVGNMPIAAAAQAQPAAAQQQPAQAEEQK